jgi:hypothetical protein
MKAKATAAKAMDMYTFRTEEEEFNVPLVHIDKHTMETKNCLSSKEWRYIASKMSNYNFDVLELLMDTSNLHMFLFYASEQFLTKFRRRLSAKLSKLKKEKDITTLRLIVGTHVSPCMKSIRDQLKRAARILMEIEQEQVASV